jgi:hypothetical protein
MFRANAEYRSPNLALILPRLRPHDLVASVACSASSTSLRSRASCLRTDSSTVAVTYAFVPAGTPRFTKPASGRNANTPGASSTYFDGLRLNTSVSQLPRPLVSFNSSLRGCNPGCPRRFPSFSFAKQL